jgi:muconolactone delta-isomerase
VNTIEALQAEIARLQRDLAERDKLIAAAGRATQWADERAQEIKRLHNIITGCPVCSELERNIRPATNSNPR